MLKDECTLLAVRRYKEEAGESYYYEGMSINHMYEKCINKESRQETRYIECVVFTAPASTDVREHDP